MQRFLFAFTIIFYACGNKHENDLHKTITQSLTQKFPDTLAAAAEKQLKIYDDKDSLNAYINLCAIVSDSLIAWKQNSLAKKFAMFAASKEYDPKADSVIKNKIGTIAFYTDSLIFDFDYSDTCAIIAETAYRNITALKQKNMLCQDLGIMYNILGDADKTALYYQLCYQGRLYLQQTDSAQPLIKRNKNLISAIINKLIFFNGITLQYDSTILYATQALQLGSPDINRTASINVLLAEALYYTGKKNESAKTIDDAWQILQHQPPNGAVLENQKDLLSIKGELLLNNGNNKEALSTFYKALDIGLKKNEYSFKDRYIGKICIDIAKAYQSAQNIDSALLYTHKALYSVTNIDSIDISSLPALSTIYRENTIMEACDAMAAALHQKYLITKDTAFLQQAVRCYTISFAAEAKLMEHFTNDGSRLTMLKESKTRSEKAIGDCYTLYQINNDSTRAIKAFEFAEKSKAIVMLESVKKNIAINSTLANDSNYKTVQKLQLQIAELGKRIYELHISGNDSSASIIQQQKQQLENSLQFAKTNLVNNNSAYRFLTQTNVQYTLADIRKNLLNNETALVEYFYGDSTAYSFYADNTNATGFYKLDTSLHASIQNMLYHFTSPAVINNNPLQFNKDAYRLYSSLQLTNIGSNIHKLIIIPDGTISFIPFDALLTKPYASPVIKNAPFFIKQFQSAYGYSVATLMQQPAFAQQQKNIVAFAPLFNNRERQMEPLTATAHEIAAIQKQLPQGKYFLQQQATLQNFKNNISGAGIIHIATHATADTAQNSMPRIEFIDSSMLLDELYAYHINANLVVLSACETGIGNIEKSEGAISMARGFYYAGAKNIITSLWNINDKSTAQLMQSFYAGTGSENYSGALQNAKLTYLSNAGSAEASPYYWAAFIQIGADKNSPAASWLWYLLILPAAFIPVMLFRKKYKNQ